MKRTPILVAAACVALLLAGCGAAAEKVGEKATEKMIEEQTGGSVDVNTDGDGSVEIETEDGTASFGTGEVPDEWPEFLGLPDDLKIQSGSTMESSDGRLVSIPAREKRRLIVYRYLRDQIFVEDRDYPEAEVNQRLALWHQDVATIRRGMVDAGLVTRHAGAYRRGAD